MGRLILGGVILLVAFVVRTAGAGLKGAGGRSSGLVNLLSLGLIVLAAVILLGSTVVVIDAGQVGVRHAFGTVASEPLLSGVRMVPPWSQVEYYSTREEQFPEARA